MMSTLQVWCLAWSWSLSSSASLPRSWRKSKTMKSNKLDCNQVLLSKFKSFYFLPSWGQHSLHFDLKLCVLIYQAKYYASGHFVCCSFPKRNSPIPPNPIKPQCVIFTQPCIAQKCILSGALWNCGPKQIRCIRRGHLIGNDHQLSEVGTGNPPTDTHHTWKSRSQCIKGALTSQ